jgi:hypothetical protein
MKWSTNFQTEELQTMFMKSRRKIIIVPHTTHIETFIVQKQFEEISPNVKTILVNKAVPLAFCKLFNIPNIPATKPHFIETLSQTLSDEFCLIWYPSAGLYNWKTGAFVCSMITQADLFITGIDYSNRRIIVDTHLLPPSKKSDIPNYIQTSQKIVSKYTPYIVVSDEAFFHDHKTASIFTFWENVFLTSVLFCITCSSSKKISMILSIVIICIFQFAIVMNRASDFTGLCHKFISASEPTLTISAAVLLQSFLTK